MCASYSCLLCVVRPYLRPKKGVFLWKSPNMPYDEQALRVLELAKEEARAFNHDYIGTEHLLLGILREGSAAAALINQGVTFEGMRGGIMFILGGRQEGTQGSQLDFT